MHMRSRSNTFLSLCTNLNNVSTQEAWEATKASTGLWKVFRRRERSPEGTKKEKSQEGEGKGGVNFLMYALSKTCKHTTVSYIWQFVKHATHVVCLTMTVTYTTPSMRQFTYVPGLPYDLCFFPLSVQMAHHNHWRSGKSTRKICVTICNTDSHKRDCHSLLLTLRTTTVCICWKLNWRCIRTRAWTISVSLPVRITEKTCWETSSFLNTAHMTPIPNYAPF